MSDSAVSYVSVLPNGMVETTKPVTFETAVMNLYSSNGGIFSPEKIVPIYIDEVIGKSYRDVCEIVLRPYIPESELSNKQLNGILNKMDFEPIITSIEKNQYLIDLTTPPDKAFKGFAMLFNLEVINTFSKNMGITSVALGETTGDTGAASQEHADGLSNLISIMLFGDGTVSNYQRPQICRLGDNLYPLCALGMDFGGCKELTDQAVIDPELSHINFVAPNSKSIARLLPQMAWYVYFCAHIAEKTDLKNIETITPSGNLGNSTAGHMAANAIRTGAELSGKSVPKIRINMAFNDNDVVPVFYDTGIWAPRKKSVRTHSNAMDVGNPNIRRLFALAGLVLDDNGCVDRTSMAWKKLNNYTTAQSVSQEGTEDTLKKYYEKGIQICPHGAVGLNVMDQIVENQMVGGEVDTDTAYASILTANPLKFSDEINGILGQNVIPEPIIDWDYDMNPRTVATYADLKNAILDITNN